MNQAFTSLFQKKAIFLDRDGVINVERGYTYKIEDFLILPEVIDALKVFKTQGFLLIIISNQGGIGKGLYTKNDVNLLHTYLFNHLKKNDLLLDEIYYCPHFPESSKCICRKPDSLMIEKAMARFGIDPTQSYFIGDKERDIEAAKKANVKGILIEANTSLKKCFDLIV
jgi:D-glycero-D-manno-heptose 1,7-bisphosphate phosphatase